MDVYKTGQESCISKFLNIMSAFVSKNNGGLGETFSLSNMATPRVILKYCNISAKKMFNLLLFKH